MRRRRAISVLTDGSALELKITFVTTNTHTNTIRLPVSNIPIARVLRTTDFTGIELKR